MKESIRDFVIWWNNSFPLDHWYRQKYGIRFGSEDHLSLDHYDILVEWEEEQLKTLIHNENIKKKKEKDYKKTGKWINDKSQELNEDFYNNISEDFFQNFDD